MLAFLKTFVPNGTPKQDNILNISHDNIRKLFTYLEQQHKMDLFHTLKRQNMSTVRFNMTAPFHALAQIGTLFQFIK